MVIAMYKGQVVEYHKDIQRMIDEKKLPADFFNRVKVKTVDGAQGDETDFLFINMVNANYTGRVGEGGVGGVGGDRACLQECLDGKR